MQLKLAKKSVIFVTALAGILTVITIIFSIMLLKENASVLGEFDDEPATYVGYYDEDREPSDNPDNAEFADNPGEEEFDFVASYDTDPIIAGAEQEIIIEQELFRLVNELRSSVGVGQLSHDDSLYRAARIRAAESATRFSHTRPNGSSYQTVFEEVGFNNYTVIGENLVYRTSSETISEEELYSIAALLFQQWQESPGHYENMVKPEYECGDVGFK